MYADEENFPIAKLAQEKNEIFVIFVLAVPCVCV